MELVTQNIKLSLNKAFVIQKLFEKQIKLFQENVTVLSNFKATDSEEAIKGYIKKIIDLT